MCRPLVSPHLSGWAVGLGLVLFSFRHLIGVGFDIYRGLLDHGAFWKRDAIYDEQIFGRSSQVPVAGGSFRRSQLSAFQFPGLFSLARIFLRDISPLESALLSRLHRFFSGFEFYSLF